MFFYSMFVIEFETGPHFVVAVLSDNVDSGSLLVSPLLV